MGDMLRGSGAAMPRWLRLTLVLALLAALGQVQAGRAPPGLEQLLADGQPEEVGFGYQRTSASRPLSLWRTTSTGTARTTRSGRPGPDVQGLLLLGRPGAPAWQDDTPAAEKRSRPHVEDHAAPSAFRERMASRQHDMQRAQLPQMDQLQVLQQPQRQQQQQWGDWRPDSPSVSSFYPAGGPMSGPVDNPERYLQALREAWVRYQQQTGAIDVGPDDLTDLETLQFLEALGGDIPGAKKRAPSAGASPGSRPAIEHQGTSSLDWAAPLVWSGYQLRKRSANPDEDDSDDWADDRADDSGVLDDDEYPGSLTLPGSLNLPSVPGPSGNRLAMLLTEQLFDERYNDPAVKRLLLTKRSAQRDDADDLVSPGGPGHAMRRRKKSTRAALVQAQAHPETAPNVQKDLARIFGDPELGDGEPEPPLALPLSAAPATSAPGAAPTATATTTAGPNKNATKHADAGHHATAPAGSPAVPLSPIGHAHETDKIAREHAQHPHQHAPGSTGSPATHNSPNTQVHVHEEHAPPMVAAEGPHGHDQAVHAEKDKATPSHAGANGIPVGAGAAGADGEQEELPIPLALSRHRRIAKKSVDWSQYFGLDRRRKKSVDWSQYFGLDRRRKKSTEFSGADESSNENAVDADWLLRQNLMGFKSSKANNINKRVAVKKEGASRDDLLAAAAAAAAAWDSAEDALDGPVADDEEEAMLQPSITAMGRCPAVSQLAESCRGVVGRDNGLVPLCVLYNACHLCGPYVGLPENLSCASELLRLGADICASAPAAREPECHAKVKAVAAQYTNSRATAEMDWCAREPCLAHFFLTAPAVAFTR